MASAYITGSEVDARIPTSVQLQALDDDADGTVDSGRLDSILLGASRWVDGLLRRTTELSTPYAALAIQAALSRACWQVYERAGQNGDNNPVQEEMESFEERLDKIGMGEGSLDQGGAAATGDVADPETDADDPSVFVDPVGL